VSPSAKSETATELPLDLHGTGVFEGLQGLRYWYASSGFGCCPISPVSVRICASCVGVAGVPTALPVPESPEQPPSRR
jgi:hypothetical protein